MPGKLTAAARLYLPLLLVLLLAAGLRFYRLDAQSLWSDEGNSVALASHSFAEIAQRTAFDIHPPLYYWLLKIWAALLGTGEAAVRSLSAVLGVGVVWLTWAVGRRLFSAGIGLTAAFIAALSPLLVYYSQETRMYMLLTFLATLTVLLAIQFAAAPRRWLAATYVLVAAAGLYTHYAYPLILIAVNGAAVFYFVANSKIKTQKSTVMAWFGLQIIPVLLYLPWLPTAWRQLTTWPGDSFSPPLTQILQTVASTLFLGLSWPYPQNGLVGLVLLVALIIPVLFFWLDISHDPSRPGTSLLLVYLWWLLPVVLTVYVFSPAFLKFLVVAVPPLALLLALTATELVFAAPQRWVGTVVAGVLLLEVAATSVMSLNAYYYNPAVARDNYRGIAQFIRAVAGPHDAVILDAEGQQDVFGYYFPANSAAGPQMYPLPRHRPLDKQETLQELKEIANRADKIYAVYWAQQQADPGGLIERWLDTHLFKATDQWYGNVRLASYASPRQNVETEPLVVRFGENIRLVGFGLAAKTVTPGDILQVALQWQAETPPAENYSVFLQLLDPSNQLVGQRDAPPSVPTTAWPAAEPVRDAHGIYVEPGTPPGRYRLIAGLYNSQTGQRLPVEDGAADFVTLAEIEVASPPEPLPRAAFNIQIPLETDWPGVRLLGYDLYKLGHRSTPETAIHPGDAVTLVTYWSRQMAGNPPQNSVTVRLVEAQGQPTPVEFSAPLASPTYPPERWQAGEIVRGQHTFFLSGLSAGTYRLEFAVGGDKTETAQSEPFVVE